MSLIAVGLAMDCLAVSVAKGLTERRWNIHALLMAVLFGVFQGGMPLVGYYAGAVFTNFFARFAPWVALALLSFIGGKMMWESLFEKEKTIDGWDIKTLLVFAVATSIDALATGVVFIPYPEKLWWSVAVIAAVSLLFSLAGYLSGVFIGHKTRINVGVIGGLILIGIGIKIFVEGVLL